MKNLLLYIVCFFVLLACNKEESIRLQKEETIITGNVTEQQRGIVIEGATVYLLEYLYPGNDDKCGTCQKIIDSTLTNANGNFEFRFNAKQGTNWNYKTWCEKQNYITKIASHFNDIVKTKTNTANLELIATGGLNIYFVNNSQNKKLFIEQVFVNSIGVYINPTAFENTTKIEFNNEDFLLEIKKIEASQFATLTYRISDYTTSGYYSKVYLIESNKYENDTIFF